jgi:radical SAM protein with 4Fe4S-binding SPASM domain
MMRSIVDPIGVFKFIVDSKFTKIYLRLLMSKCDLDSDYRLNIALEVFSGIRHERDICWKCRFVYNIVKKIVRIGSISFGADLDEIRGLLRDPYWRRGLAGVIKGISMFGVRKPFVPGAPFLVVWDVTYSCNLRCKHCYANAGGSSLYELSTNDAKRVIDILSDAGVVSIAWSGGEPLVRPDIFELSRYAWDKGIYISMATNGTILNEYNIDMLWRSGVRFLQISLDAADPSIHDEFRGVKGVWGRTLNGIKLAVKKGFFVNVAFTATKYNFRDIPKMIDLLENIGVSWFMLYNFVPTGRGVDIIEKDLTPDEREELLKYLWGELQRRNIGLLTTAPYYSRVGLSDFCGLNNENIIFPTHFQNANLSGRLVKLTDFIGGCGAGRFYIGLSPDGSIRPCVFLPIKIGNILEIGDRFEDWWKSNDVLLKLRDKDILKGKCGICEYRYVCGGCRARAYGYFHDYLAPDPGCILNKDVYYSFLESQVASG